MLSGSIATLTSLDFLGFGLPPGSPSLGELLNQGKNNLQAPWLGISGFLVVSRHALAAGLRRRGGPRRLRPAQDVPLRKAMALLEVEDLGVALRRRGAGRRAVRAPRSRSIAARRWPSSARAARASRSPRCRSCSCCPIRMASHPSGSIRFDGQELVGRDDRFMRAIRGRRIGMIFQEPMTSLNPLHTVERQISEVLFVHRGLGRAAARARAARAAAAGPDSRPRGAARRLPAPALRRPAAARDDRHGAGQRARPPDRRRADHRAGRHHPGADPAAAEAAAGAARHGDPA